MKILNRIWSVFIIAALGLGGLQLLTQGFSGKSLSNYSIQDIGILLLAFGIASIVLKMIVAAATGELDDKDL